MNKEDRKDLVEPIGYCSLYGLTTLGSKAHHYCLSVSKAVENEFEIPLYAHPPASSAEITRLRRELEEARKSRGKMSEYTPGDWTVEINDGRVNVWGRRGELLVADCGIVSNAFSQANAQLIVDAVNSYPRAHRDERT
jgi:hypothetical protein